MPISQGTQFGPYRILEPVGSGGMGDVYRALDTRLNREVAIKVVSDQYLAEAFGSGTSSPRSGTHTSGTPGTVSHRRFLREAQSSSALNHPNICTIHDIGEHEGRPFLVMELLRGQTLKQALRDGPLSATEVVTYSRQAAAALAAAHALGIVHRDIKPANIFLTGPTGAGQADKRQIKILDFGLAKQQGTGDLADSNDATATFGGQATAIGADIGLTSPGSTIGTVAYMSPEQAEGKVLDPRTDLFSLGSVIYEMATGAPPFTGATSATIFAALLTKDPPPVSAVNPAMPPRLDAIVAQLLVKDRDHRTQTAETLVAELDALTTAASSISGSSASHAAASGSFAASSGTYAAASHLSGAVPAASSASIPVATPPPDSSHAIRNSILGVAVILIALTAGFFWWKHSTAPTPAATATAQGAPSSAVKNAIIVADFVNQTGDPVFESTLNQALAVQLGQSPVLDIIGQRHLHQSLKYLGKKPDTVITPEIAREIGEREGIKAILTGTISNLGGDYIITLAAQNTATGEEIASVQTQAPAKDKVLDALNQGASQMRAKLGESLASIQKLNTPFGQATTPSLEAFRAYALGDAAHARGNDIPEAEGHYKRALDLDPKLAMAWARLGVIYLNSGQTGKAMEYFSKAHELSNDVSERERFYIDGHYYAEVLGDLNKATEILQVAIQEYPLQIDNYINIGVLYGQQGELDKERDVLLKSLAIQPDDAVALGDLMVSYARAGQPEEAEKYMAQAKKLGLNGTDILVYEMILDAVTGDYAAAQKVLTTGAGRPDQFVLWRTWALFQEQRGQFQESRKSYQQAAGFAESIRAKDAQASLLLAAASSGWVVGQCQDVDGAVKQALALDKSKPTQRNVAISLAVCGQAKAATDAIDALEKKFPQDTLVQQLGPQYEAIIAINDSQPQKALDLLTRSQGLDLVSIGPYLRGLAYLQLKDAQNAIASFKIASLHKLSASPYAMSLLGLGRAYALAGDKANAKKSYEAFFAAWKDADPGLPIVAQAKKEYASL
jgi:serine/threonine protein kinase/tetratricopeptide (TPR) repeat protein